MNIAEASIRNSTVTWVVVVLTLVLGYWSYQNLPRLEDPEFTIKTALVVTPYPGATSHEVAEEVTNVIEMAVQEMEQLDYVESRSERGRSTVQLHILESYNQAMLPQVWDELRRKINDAQRHLPPGAGPSVVIDNFGDVYGILFALTGPDFSQPELYEVAKMLQRELLLVPDVKKIELFGVQPEVIYVEMQRDRMAQLGIRPEEVAAALREQNLVVPAGSIEAGSLELAISPTGEWRGVEDFESLLIRGASQGNLVFLRDIATVRRDLIDPPVTTLRYDGEQAIGLGISTISGGNVVSMGEAVKERLRQLQGQIPLGMELQSIAFQAESVVEAVDAFVKNLVAAVLIVFVVLLIAMGLRSGLIIGTVLVITMAGTFIAMQAAGTILERISLGALIIALGMLVDNAIVITEGMLMAMKRGHDRLAAAKQVVTQTAFPLLGSTAIAILAFGAIGLSQDNTGEFTRSLFVVLLISLSLSWITAVTVTPLFGYFFLKSEPAVGEEKNQKDPTDQDPYAGRIYQVFRRLLVTCMLGRWRFLAGTLLLLAVALFGFRWVSQSFFPDSTRPQFMVDIWLPVGTHLADTDRVAEEMRQQVAQLPGVTNVATTVGRGTLRFLLTYYVEQDDTSFAQLIVQVEDYRDIATLLPQVQSELTEEFPDALIIAKRFFLGPGQGGRIQARFSGPDHDVLRSMAEETMGILHADGGAKGVRLDSREKVAVLRPQFSEAQARLAGITRSDLGRLLETTFSGRTIGVYRERDNLLPVIARSPQSERADPDSIQDLQIFSPVADAFIPVRQVVSGFAMETEDPIIMRRNRQPTITVHADQMSGLASTLRDRVAPQIEAIELPPGYQMEWGGEYEDSTSARRSVAEALPLFILLMFLIVVTLFNNLRITAIIWLTVPLAAIGVVAGLLIFQQPMGFMAMLGALSLSGMLIKNSIVLLDEINLQLGTGCAPWDAVVQAAVSRVRPVSMAAITTVFGLLPLVTDAFFGAMAVTIVVGLLFATVLTLFVIPVLYVTFFRVAAPADGK